MVDLEVQSTERERERERAKPSVLLTAQLSKQTGARIVTISFAGLLADLVLKPKGEGGYLVSKSEPVDGDIASKGVKTVAYACVCVPLGGSSFYPRLYS